MAPTSDLEQEESSLLVQRERRFSTDVGVEDLHDDDHHIAVSPQSKPASPPRPPPIDPAAAAHDNAIKWGSLLLLVVQNSSLFVLSRLSRAPPDAPKKGKDHLYLTSVVVLLVELFKMAICLTLVLKQSGYSVRAMLSELHRHVLLDIRTTMLLGVPAACYALQNNLIFVAITNLSAAAAQVLYQLKTLSTAFFSVAILRKTFRIPQWISFLLLMVGVVFVQSQDAKSSTTATGAYPALGVISAVAAAALSGFAGVFLEKMFTSGGTSLWMRNVQLGLFAIPLQLLAIYQLDYAFVVRHGPLHNFHFLTWVVVAVQVAGSLLTAIVIKFAGNILKTFATVLALLMTCVWSMVLFADFHPTPLFVAGVAITATSVWLYARPDDPGVLLAMAFAKLMAAVAPSKAANGDSSNGVPPAKGADGSAMNGANAA